MRRPARHRCRKLRSGRQRRLRVLLRWCLHVCMAPICRLGQRSLPLHFWRLLSPQLRRRRMPSLTRLYMQRRLDTALLHDGPACKLLCVHVLLSCACVRRPAGGMHAMCLRVRPRRGGTQLHLLLRVPGLARLSMPHDCVVLLLLLLPVVSLLVVLRGALSTMQMRLPCWPLLHCWRVLPRATGAGQLRAVLRMCLCLPWLLHMRLLSSCHAVRPVPCRRMTDRLVAPLLWRMLQCASPAGGYRGLLPSTVVLTISTCALRELHMLQRLRRIVCALAGGRMHGNMVAKA